MAYLAKTENLFKSKGEKSVARNRSLNDIILVFRPWSFIMTAVSVTVGSFLGLLLQGRFSLFLCLLVLTGVVLVHAASNLLNDYFDTLYGIDKAGALMTIYRRHHPLLNNIMSPREILIIAFVLYLLAGLIGVYIFSFRGWPVLALAFIGIVAGIEYSASPCKYKSRGLGEIVVFFLWGPIMTAGSYYVQTGIWQGYKTVLIVSLPLGIWVALVLLANNLKDMGYDGEMNIITVPLLLGKEKSLALFAGMVYSIYLFTIAGVLLKMLSGWTLLVFFSLPFAIRLMPSFKKLPKFPYNAEPKTANIFGLYGGLLIISLLAQYISSL